LRYVIPRLQASWRALMSFHDSRNMSHKNIAKMTKKWKYYLQRETSIDDPLFDYEYTFFKFAKESYCLACREKSRRYITTLFYATSLKAIVVKNVTILSNLNYLIFREGGRIVVLSLKFDTTVTKTIRRKLGWFN